MGKKIHHTGIEIVMPNTEPEAAAVIAMRAAWYRKTGAQEVPIPSNALWFIARVALTQEVVGCMAVVPSPPPNPVVITEVYLDERRIGKMALRALLDKLDGLKQTKSVIVPIDNQPLLKILSNNGWETDAMIVTKREEETVQGE